MINKNAESLCSYYFWVFDENLLLGLAEIKEETYNEEDIRKIAEMQTKYETRQKEKEAELLRLKNTELEEKNQQIIRQKQDLQNALERLHHSEIKYILSHPNSTDKSEQLSSEKVKSSKRSSN